MSEAWSPLSEILPEKKMYCNCGEIWKVYACFAGPPCSNGELVLQDFLVASLQSAASPAFEFRLEGTFEKRQRQIRRIERRHTKRYISKGRRWFACSHFLFWFHPMSDAATDFATEVRLFCGCLFGHPQFWSNQSKPKEYVEWFECNMMNIFDVECPWISFEYL